MKSIEKAKTNEKLYTENYKHIVNGQEITGTVFPNGLNATKGGRGAEEFIDLPIVDIIAMLTLGKFRHKNILKILIKEYDLPTSLSKRTVITRLNDLNLKNLFLRKYFLKPVILRLLEDKNFFTFKEICEAVNLTDQGLRNLCKKWFGGKTFFSFNDGFDNEIERIEAKYNTSLVQWALWAIETTTHEQIGNLINRHPNSVNSFYHKISKFLVGQENLNFIQIKKIMRKRIAIKLLRQGVNPLWIVNEVFKSNKIHYKETLEVIFNMSSFDDIMKKYFDTEI